MDWATVAGLTKADSDNQGALEESTVDRVAAEYDGLDWYDHAAISTAATAAAGIVQSSARVSASMTGAYLTRASRAMGISASPARVLSLSDPLRMGVASWATAYGRPADTVRFEVSKGATDLDAIEAGMLRLDAITRTDLTLARRAQSQATFTDMTAVVGYRRVVHPELSKTGTCGLCIAASDRTYYREALMPIHHRCKCTVLPVTREHDPGSPWDMDDAFFETYSLSTTNRALDLKETRVRYEENGELGPILVAGQRSANPGSVRAAREANGLPPARRPDTRAASQEELSAARRLRSQSTRQAATV